MTITFSYCHLYKSKSPLQGLSVRYQAESNCCTRFCRPLPNHSAMVPLVFWERKDINYFADLQIILHNFSKYSLSTSSKVPVSALSISRTPAIPLPGILSGTTISDLERELHAMCPGKSSTSSTTILLPSFQADPQTPFPYLILVHATGPWKGPRTSSSPCPETAGPTR